MTFREMKFKGKSVFVEFDGDGEIKTENGRAYMKYKEDDERVYRPYPQNLTDLKGAPLEGLPQTARPSPARENEKKPRQEKTQMKQTPPTRGAQGEVIIAYTDGACIGNPGPSGLGYTVLFPDGRQISRGEPLGKGTNNIAELTAIKRVLEQIDDPSRTVLIHTDSEYSIGVLVKGWKAKANRELITSIRKLLAHYSHVELRKVRGHAGIPENERVDQLARGAAETQSIIDE